MDSVDKQAESSAATSTQRTRQANVTIDQRGAKYERIVMLKNSRSGTRGVVTKKQNELFQLMKDPRNVDQVREKLIELELALRNFNDAHDKYHFELIDECAIQDSNEYFDTVRHMASDIIQTIDFWLRSAQFNLQEKLSHPISLHPEDSISNVGSVRSNMSQTSARSRSTVSARLKASAKKAALSAQAAALKEQQAIQREELLLQQKKENLRIETELAMAKAEERVYTEHEDQSSLILPCQLPLPTPYEVNGDGTDVSKRKPMVHPEAKHFLLTPEVPEWRDCKEPSPTDHPENIHDESSEPHLNLSDGSVTQMVDVHRLQQQQNQQLQELLKQQQRQTLALTLPQPEVPVFSGNPVEYSDFVRAFENLIELKTSSPNTRLYYLVQYTSGEVKELMRSCLSMNPGEGYSTARVLLKSRYGQSYKIATALIDRVTKTPQIKADDGLSLRRYSVMLTSCKNALKEIGYLSKIENPDTLQRIIERLPFGLRQKWRDKADRITEEWGREVTIEDIAEFVELKARAANHPVFGNIRQSESKSSVSNNDLWRKQRKPERTSRGSAYATQGNPLTSRTDHYKGNANIASSKSVFRCPRCEADHFLSRCEVFRGSSVDERLKFMREKGLCHNCLKPGHVAMSCPKESFCRIAHCQLNHRKHSTFLHLKDNKSSRTEAEASANPPPSNTEISEPTEQGRNCFVEAEESVCNATGAGESAMGLAMVPVKVRAKGKEKMIETYAFLDPGSNTSFCTDKLIEQLGASGKKTALSLTTMNAENVRSRCTVVSLEVCDLQGNNTVQMHNVFSRPKLPVAASDIPLQDDVERWPHLKGIKLPHIDAEIGLLIGNDVPKALEPKEVRQSDDGGPYAVRTLLGWTINGPLGRGKHSNHIANFIQTRVELDTQFEKFCEMEFNDSQFSAQKAMSQEDRRALTMMKESTKLRDGHYEIGLPWRVFPPDLPNNKVLAERRLQLLSKRLVKDPELHHKYLSFMDDLFEKDYARKVLDDQIGRDGTPAWYLPHHPVVHSQKPGRVRVVFDCAAEFQNTSLNQQLLQGPDLTNSLVGVLTRFREEVTAIMADVEKMFYQVRVPTKDSNYLRFLWWPGGDVNRAPEEYQMHVHLFGGVSSPSCANYGLLRTADDNKEHFDEEAIQTVRRNFYVDDCLKSVNGDQQAVRLVGQLRELLYKGGFRLTKWVSNSLDVMESVPESERAGPVKELDLDNLPVERALGMQWEVQSDTFHFKIVVKDRPPTRRGILSVVSSIYDPLGFVSPLILTAKAILRDLCRKRLDWDDKIPPEDLVRWQSWLEELPKLQQFSVQRCLKPRNFGHVVSNQLHNFSDASQEGYGAVSYLRVVNGDGDTHCAFLIGKSRQTPSKSVTIPRLELSAAVVATRLNSMMQSELDLAIDKVFFWTDSTCVLSYIANQDKRFQTFVANRIATIHEATQPNQWKYVDTRSNPADDASRGLSAEDFVQSKRWISGPAFLWKEEDQWPKQSAAEKIEEGDQEIKREAKALATATTDEIDPIGRMIQSCSSWYKLKRIMAWVLRYRSNLLRECRRNRSGVKVLISERASLITVEEMHAAEKEILRHVQLKSFREELLRLQNRGSKVHTSTKNQKGTASSVKKSSPMHKLDPVLIDGLLCVGGRLQHAPIEDEQRHPVILPGKHHVVDLIVRHFHLISGHSGLEHVLSLIREGFWITKARVAVRRVLSPCFSCRRRQAPVGVQKMADLPADRVTPSKPPFSFVGVDCFGPFWVRRGRSQVKRYGVLFTCLATRAIHIEIAQTMDADSFINSMRRFIARRGLPELMRSDNGTNFVGGNRELREAIAEWNDQQIHNFLLQRNVKWVFNPPSGSHFGGVWERCIRTVRKVLNALVREQTLDDEGLTTLMCEAESIVNSRPITKSSDDPSDAEALTPNHLLLLRSGPSLPPGHFGKEDTFSRRRWRQVQYLADVFWRRWVREYLPQLQERQKWADPSRNFAIGDIVLVVDDRVPRSSWPLGRVLDVHKNSGDGRVRSVSVKTRTAVMNRPIDKIVLLETVEMSEDA